MISQLVQNKTLLIVAACLVVYGLAKPDLSKILIRPDTNVVNVDLDVSEPKDEAIRSACDKVVEVLENGPSSKNNDGIRLSSLYRDLANLVSLDGDDQVIKSTLEIREANRLAGIMLRLDLKGKYPGLADAANGVVVTALGSDDVVLDENLRTKAVEAFKALSWACYEGSK